MVRTRRAINCRKSGREAMEITGFRLEMEGDVEYYVMKAGNLNIPWLRILTRELQKTKPGNRRERRPEVPMETVGETAADGVNEDLLLYYSGMSTEELQTELGMIMLQLREDADVAHAIDYIQTHPDIITQGVYDPEILPGIQKLQSNPAFRAISYVLETRMRQYPVC